MNTETQNQINAIIWWTSCSPAEMVELRDKYLPDAALIDMSTENIETIWNRLHLDKDKNKH